MSSMGVRCGTSVWYSWVAPIFHCRRMPSPSIVTSRLPQGSTVILSEGVVSGKNVTTLAGPECGRSVSTRFALSPQITACDFAGRCQASMVGAEGD